MALEDIGFYTLSDARAKQADAESPLWRCELILTPACNFNCPYCRGFQEKDKYTLSWAQAKTAVDYWLSEGMKNIRFSGGEPTLWPHLPALVEHCATNDVERIAISTNGSANTEMYYELWRRGCNDFSVSLDACCASTASVMAGRDDIFDTVTGNIRELSRLTYVTVGVVLTEDNINEVEDVIELAWDLGVADIRLITAAQENRALSSLSIPNRILRECPILRYRYNNIKNGRHVRGLCATDNRRCPLVLDDMAVLNGQHYPCIIYMREWGQPIGELNDTVRQARAQWAEEHDCWNDPICRRNCLDVCIDYNNEWLLKHDRQNSRTPARNGQYPR